MLSAAQGSTLPPSFTAFNSFASAVGCTQTPGSTRLACLKQVPASIIRNFTNGPSGGLYVPIVDKYIHNLERFQPANGS
jgi:hypothetical protein